MDYRTYYSLNCKFKEGNRIQHMLVPGLNLYKYDKLKNASIAIPNDKNFDYTFHDYQVLCTGRSRNDVTLNLVERKSRWLKKLSKILPANNKTAFRELRHFRRGVSSRISAQSWRLLEHMKEDPLPGFEGDRNWLFNGSTVSALSGADDEPPIFFFADKNNLSTISTFRLDDNSKKTEGCSFDLKIDEPIMQTCTNGNSQNPLVCVRQKNNINILRPTTTSFDVLRKKKTAHPNYFTSVAMDGTHVAFSQYSGSVAIFDIEANHVEFASLPREWQCPGKNEWNQIHWRENGMILACSKRITYIDNRIPQSCWRMHNKLRNCEEICNVFRAGLDNNLNYIATNHNLYLADIRMQSIVQQWTHLMHGLPDFGQAVKIDGVDLVVLQSQVPQEAVAIANDGKLSLLPARHIPTVPDALRRAQIHGFDPDFAERANSTIVGFHLIENKGAIRQVLQNGAGDVLIRNIHRKKCKDSCDNNDETFFSSWKEHMEMSDGIMTSKPKFTEVVDMSNVFNLLHQPSQPQNSQSSQDPWQSWSHRNRFEPANLVLYKDHLAQRILDTWGIKAAVTSDDDQKEDEGGYSSMDENEKVLDWLKRMDVDHLSQ